MWLILAVLRSYCKGFVRPSLARRWAIERCLRNLVLLKLVYFQRTKWLILHLLHFGTAKAIYSSNLVEIIG